MTPQQIVGTGLRLLALWLAINSAKYLLSIPMALITAKLDNNNVYSYATGVAFIIAAVILWFFPMWISHKIVPRTRFENHINIQPVEALRVGCSLIGLWFFANAIPNLVWFLFRSFTIVSNDSAFQTLDPNAKLDIAVSLFEVIFGLVLVFRSSDFANFTVRQSQASADGE